MRVPATPPPELSDAQRPLHDDMKAGIERNFQGFVAVREDGALVGPWAPWLRTPAVGGPIWELTKALSLRATLPGPVREVAILVTGARFKAGYEIYAHSLVGRRKGLADPKIATIVAGERPVDLTREEAVAYDVAAALVGGGVLPRLAWEAAVTAFGDAGAAELCYLVGLYCLVAVTLNAFNVTVPEETPVGA